GCFDGLHSPGPRAQFLSGNHVLAQHGERAEVVRTLRREANLRAVGRIGSPEGKDTVPPLRPESRRGRQTVSVSPRHADAQIAEYLRPAVGEGTDENPPRQILVIGVVPFGGSSIHRSLKDAGLVFESASRELSVNLNPNIAVRHQ